MITIQKFFDEDDYLPLRRESYNFVVNFVNGCVPGTSLLEIGPSGILDKNTSYSEWDTSSYVKQQCELNDIEYKTCDILPGCDYQCSIESLSNIGRKFDYIIANNVLEHVSRIWLVPNEIKQSLRIRMLIITPFMFKIHGPKPDCWRISPDGYKVLFGSFGHLSIDSYPPQQHLKNGIPLLIKAEIGV